ncbi:MAG: hypothetical protein CL709_04060 [Chloroflexi bacterium]|nr:hypothetical protein [Chloroflexota bacterium]
MVSVPLDTITVPDIEPDLSNTRITSTSLAVWTKVVLVSLCSGTSSSESTRTSSKASVLSRSSMVEPAPRTVSRLAGVIWTVDVWSTEASLGPLAAGRLGGVGQRGLGWVDGEVQRERDHVLEVNGGCDRADVVG